MHLPDIHLFRIDTSCYNTNFNLSIALFFSNSSLFHSFDFLPQPVIYNSLLLFNSSHVSWTLLNMSNSSWNFPSDFYSKLFSEVSFIFWIITLFDNIFHKSHVIFFSLSYSNNVRSEFSTNREDWPWSCALSTGVIESFYSQINKLGWGADKVVST